MERGGEQGHAAFNAWKYQHYFEFDSVKGDKNISVHCTLCVGRKLLSTAKNSTSNLSKHLASRHRNVKLTEKPPDPPTDMPAAATTSNSTGRTSKGPSPAKQVKIDLKTTGLSAAELKKLVAGYIVEEMLPISTVASLPDVIVKAIKICFDAVLDSQEGLLAAATCPKFKLGWLTDERRREHVKELLTTECREAAPAADNANVVQLVASPAEMDFFDSENQPTESFSAEKEVTDYLRSGYELEVLNQFPYLKKMYMKYNTPTPSSAPVERLFSLGGLVLSPKRNRLSDRRFEKLLLMRYNHCFTPKENKKT